MTIYYRVTLKDGVVPEEHRGGSFVPGHPEYGVTMFKSLRAAREHFKAIASAEVHRLKELVRAIKSTRTRKALINDRGQP